MSDDVHGEVFDDGWNNDDIDADVGHENGWAGFQWLACFDNIPLILLFSTTRE